MSVKPTNPVINRSHPLARGLVGAWTFQDGGGSVLRDVSGHGHDGTLTNMDPATDWVTSRYGGALDFDGVNDYVDCGAGDHLNRVSVAVWCTPASGSRGDIAGVWGSGNSIREFILLKGTVADRFALYVTDGSSFPNAVSSTAIVAGREYFVVGTYDGSNVSIFVDGSLEASTSSSLSVQNTSEPMKIGASADANFDGGLSAVFMWNRAISANEVADLYTRPFELYEPAIGTQERYYERVALGAAGQPAFKRWSQRSNQPVFGRGF